MTSSSIIKGDRIRVLRGVSQGKEGRVTGFTPTRRSCYVVFDGVKRKAAIRISVLEVITPPTPPSTSFPTSPISESSQSNRSGNTGQYIYYSHDDYRSAHIRETLSEPINTDFNAAIDSVIDKFIGLGFGSGDPALAFFQQKLDRAQEAYVGRSTRRSSTSMRG